ncbi:MAG TPA: penicillin acylase family protein [Nocardioides sp.]|uniref:penicillin acylase family protein n=1 Tax=Nocardioides sp. TaxID=35761 RepID=UPI002D7E8623|nr:penicillin acylase family protein [Nocardioides sp.]HET6653427.1 penicillin acylase family protein [Nocardioides sp.]
MSDTSTAAASAEVDTRDDEASDAGRGPGPRARFRAWPRAGRWATYAAIVVVLVMVAGLVTGVVVVRRSFPQTDGEISVPGLNGEVEVVRDAQGIPQVYAGTSHDLFYAQGFVQAQDRFYEMDVRRHVTAGRLSEMLGEDALDTDKFIRTMGWRRVAEEELSMLEPETLSYLEAFSDGVNAYIEGHTPSEMSLEYSALALNGLDYTVEEWTPADSVAWLKAMAWDLRSNMEDEVTRAIMAGRHSEADIAELFPPYPYDRHRPIVEQGAVVDGVYEQGAEQGGTRRPSRPPFDDSVVAALEDLKAGIDAMPELMGHGDGIGSNGWVVDGEHSTTGQPILANDPHLGISVPGIWYQMGLHCTEVTAECPFDVTGFTFAGLPGVIIGHNRDVAWGFTNLGPDVVDLYLEKIEGQRYEYDGRTRRLDLRDETIEVLGRDEPFTFTVRSTRHGPLLSDVSAELSTVGANSPTGEDAPERGNGYGVAISWTALQPSNTADAIFGIDTASSWDDFRAAAADFAAPSQNMVYADREGHIGYQAPGLIPIRKSGNTGDYPAEGWLPSDDWTGKYVPFDALPSVLDPDDGFVATANQAVTGPAYPYFLGDSWAYGYRSQRIVELLERKEKLSVADMEALQLDDRNGFAPTMVPYLLDVLMPSEYLGAGQRLLLGWDYEQDADSAAAAYFNAVWDKTLELTFHDDLREAVWPDGGGRWFEVMRTLLADPTSHWWDDVETEGVVETRDDILAGAMAAARDDLVRRQSRRAVDWTWGHHHRLNLENETVGQSPVRLVQWLFNRGGYEVGGGGEIVNATKWDAATDSFEVTAAPSMRMVVSMADLDDSRWVNLTGVSGHAFNDHYVDQTELWAEGRSLPWYFSREALGETAEQTLTLRPAE